MFMFTKSSFSLYNNKEALVLVYAKILKTENKMVILLYNVVFFHMAQYFQRDDASYRFALMWFTFIKP